MMTPPMLQNSPNSSSFPIGNAGPAVNTGTSRQAPGPGTSSFGKVLAQEINDKSDVPESSSVEANSAPIMLAATMTAPNPALNNVPENENTVVDNLRELKDLKDTEDSEGIKDLKDSKDLQEGLAIYSTEAREIKETKTDATAIAISPRQMGLANILHGLIVAYSPDSRTAVRTAAITEIPTDSPAGIQADTSADAQTERITIAAQYAGLSSLQPGLAAGHSGKTGTGADTLTALQPPEANDPTPGPLGMLTAATPTRVKQDVDIRDIHQSIRKGSEIKLELGARRSDPQQTGFRLTELSLSVETGKAGNMLPELTLQSLNTEGLHTEGLPTAGLPNTSVMPTVIVAEHSVAPAASGTGVQPAPWLEPHIGATGWDNALGQKVLWMVSNQLQVAELNLNPPDLGPLQVLLSITNDQASATFVSQHIDVRQALEAALPRLKEMMAESGINLGNTTVSADTPQQHEGHGGFEPQDRPAPRHRGDEETVDMSNAKNADAGIGRFHTSDMGRVGHLGESRLVDTFA